MKVYKQSDNIIFEIPFWSKRFNPYMVKEDGTAEDIGEHPTLVGLISYDKNGNQELGWAKVIDMDYKGKNDQFTDYLIHWWKSEEEFRKICKEMGLDIVEIPYYEKP